MSAAAATSTRRIIVVDDQPATLREVAERLGPHVPELVPISNPAECVRLLQAREPYGLLLLDIQMEPLSGLKLLQLARQLDGNAAVIMMTADGSAEAAIAALKAGAVDFVVKPITEWEALARSIDRALRDREVRRHNLELLEQLEHSKAELDRAVDLLRKLNVTAQKMHVSRSAAEILDMLVTTASECLSAQRVSIMINDPSSDEMVVQAGVGIDRDSLRGQRVKPWEGVAGTVLAQRAPIVVNRGRSSIPLPQDEYRAARYDGTTYMCIPIILAGGAKSPDRIMGVMNLTERDGDLPFSTAEVEFAVHLSRQAALALASAALWSHLGK